MYRGWSWRFYDWLWIRNKFRVQEQGLDASSRSNNMEEGTTGVERGSLKLKLTIAAILVATVAALTLFNLPTVPTWAEQVDLSAPSGSNSQQSLKVKLGLLLFSDTTLSSPTGQACISCHSPSAGFTFPDSRTNEIFGVAPGAVKGRQGNRAVPTIGYASFIQEGPPQYDPDLTAYVGGLFWDGRATDLANQATFPFQNPNEMNDFVHNLFDVELVATKVACSPEADLFRKVFGPQVFSRSAETIFTDVSVAMAAYEMSSEVSPFSSKYDAYIAGRVKFTAA
ncbi:MAG TPA: cytochrome-c peroxidase, partial [Tepidisphaeraceae bacterium]